MALLSIKITTPEKLVFEGDEIDSASFPTPDGEITILPHHIPLVTKIATGEIVIRKKGNEYSLVATDGFLKLTSDGVITVLADYAVRSEDIELAKVEEARKKAEAAMKEKVSQKDFAIAEADLRRTLMELKISQKRRKYQPKI